MCVPGCRETVIARLGRRGFVRGGALAVAAGAAGVVPASPARAEGFSRVVDLTHTLDGSFPTFVGEPGVELQPVFTYEEHGLNLYDWAIAEHSGTHMDAPIHFAEEAQTADEIPVEHLVVPLAVIDIAGRAENDADTRLTPDDITAFEARHGPVPEGACVAMHSGWQRHLGTRAFRGADADGVMHFPGFHEEAARMLIEERTVIGIAVDTLSLDHGASAEFPVHYLWLPSNRWGLECVANLAELPPVGATIVAGGPKIRGATGGPSRVIALV
jgi:kynurenine formamidase